MPTPIEGTRKIKIKDIIIGENHRKDTGDLLSLANSMSTQGLIDPVVVDTNNNFVAGYRRIEAAKLLKWEEIEARIYESLSPAERRKIQLEEDIAQKKARSWQEEVMMKQELHELLLAEKGKKRTAHRGSKPWSQADTAERLGVSNSGLSDDLRLADAISHFPELAAAGTKKDALRKMYVLREMMLLQSISQKMQSMGMEIEDEVSLKNKDAYVALKELPNESFDCCITDPPWGIEIEKAGSARSIDYQQFDDTHDVWKKFTDTALPEIFRILKEGSHFWLFFGPENYQATRDAIEKAGFDVRYVPCIWIKEKPNYTDTEFKPMPGYEMFFYCVRRKNKEVAPRRLNEATSDCFQYSRTPIGRIHRTEKPIELLKRLISLSTGEGDRILDPFAGSGSTLCATLVLRRKGLGFELDKGMYEAADGRLQAMKMEIAEKSTEISEEVV